MAQPTHEHSKQRQATIQFAKLGQPPLMRQEVTLMKKLRGTTTRLAALAVALVLATAFFTGCQSPTSVSGPDITIGGQQEGIWVNGTGEVQATPDIAVINLGVQAQAPTVAEAQEQSSQAMQAVMDALKTAGIADKDIKTTGYNIWQQSRWDPDKQEEIVTGYQVSNSVEVTIRNVTDAGETIDAVVKAGGDNIRVNGIRFEVDDPSAYLEEAREKAAADAKAKAEQLADLAEVKLGKPTYITEGYSVPVVYSDRAYAMEEAQAAGAPPISAGETTITATIQIVYEID